jgi:hypothetical protein
MIEWKRISGPILALTYVGWFGIVLAFPVVLAILAPFFEAACKDLGLALPGDIVLLFAAARGTRSAGGALAWVCISLAPLALLAYPAKREWKILSVTVIATVFFFLLIAVTGVFFHAWWLISAARAN